MSLSYVALCTACRLVSSRWQLCGERPTAAQCPGPDLWSLLFRSHLRRRTVWLWQCNRAPSIPSSDATSLRSKWLTSLVLRTRDSSSNHNFFSDQIGVTSKRPFPSFTQEAGGYLILFQSLSDSSKSIRFKIMEAAGVPKRVYRDSGSDTSASQGAPPFLDAA